MPSEAPLLADLLPEGVAAAQTSHDAPESILHPEERSRIRDAVPPRRAEYASVRCCARRAMSALGVPPAPVRTGVSREPIWPVGLVGSLTHCAGFRGAAVALSCRMAAVGIDAEENAALPEGVGALVADDDEQRHLAELGAGDRGVAWDRLLFSAKESIFKAWFPLTRSWLDFTDCRLQLDPRQHRFSGEILVRPPPGGREVRRFEGVWSATASHLLTACWVGPS
ncbi:4'-phosphopantetheinyl transferase family protein [Nesterenkonia populi]